MKSINIREARMHLLRLVARVQAGEEFIIVKAGKPVARLVPTDAARRPVGIGGLKARTPLPEDFDSMFGEEIAATFGEVPPVKHKRPGAP